MSKCKNNKRKNKKEPDLAGLLLPIILAPWKAEIGRIVVQGQPGQNVQETASPK
jgi:hypothetical protein